MTWPNLQQPGYNVKKAGWYTDNRWNVLSSIGWWLTGRYKVKRLETLAKYNLDRYMEVAWIEEENFVGWRWEKYHTKLIIVAAANRYRGIIVMGTRHHSPSMTNTIEAYGGIEALRKYCGDDGEQGFVDQYGTFYDRKEAWILAEQNGQIRYPDVCGPGRLFSENLY